LKKLVTDRLVGAGLTYDGATAFATPRRLTLAVAGIPVRQPDVKEERKGPRVDANEKASPDFSKPRGLHRSSRPRSRRTRRRATSTSR